MPLYNADLKPLAAGASTHDWQHAAKLFLSDNYRLAPKQSFLYYVCINVNQNFLKNLIGMGISSQGLSDQYETGMLVKSIELPKFTMDTKTLNAYNRKNIVQNKIQYDPVTVTFHDDAANVVLKFWNDYYTYYFRDSDYEPGLYGVPHKYDLRQRTNWGYGILNSNLEPFLRDIQIFSLNQKRFTEYRLINPYITSWRHGEHNSAEGAGVMQCQMTIAYETVKYRTGYVNPVDVNGFSLLHYDDVKSPIATSTTNIYTSQGIFGVAEGAATDLSRPDGSVSGVGFISNYTSIKRAYDNLRSANLSTTAQKTLAQIGVNAVAGAINGAANALFVPTVNSLYNGTQTGVTATGTTNLPGASGGSFINTGTARPGQTPYAYGYNSGYVTSGSNLIDRWTGAVVGRVNQATDTYFQGLSSSGVIKLGADGQPITGTQTVQVMDGYTGETLPQHNFTVNVTAGGGYISSDPTANIVETKFMENSDGTITTYNRYMNGDTRVTTTDVTGAQVAQEVTRSTTQTGTVTRNPYTNPNSANYIRIDPANPIGSIVGGVTNRFVNTAVNAIINPITGKIDQWIGQGERYITGLLDKAWNGVTGQLETLWGTVTGTGGATGASDLVNIVDRYQVLDPEKGVLNLTEYADGSIMTKFEDGSFSFSEPYKVDLGGFSTYTVTDNFGDQITVFRDDWMNSGNYGADTVYYD